jgi:hypothetical protein
MLLDFSLCPIVLTFPGFLKRNRLTKECPPPVQFPIASEQCRSLATLSFYEWKRIIISSRKDRPISTVANHSPAFVLYAVKFHLHTRYRYGYCYYVRGLESDPTIAVTTLTDDPRLLPFPKLSSVTLHTHFLLSNNPFCFLTIRFSFVPPV